MTFATGGGPHAGSQQWLFANLYAISYYLIALTLFLEKNILSNLLIIILSCIVRILWQNIQKLMTELHLAVLRNKKEGHAESPREELRPWQRS